VYAYEPVGCWAEGNDVTIRDAILALKIVADMPYETAVWIKADVKGDKGNQDGRSDLHSQKVAWMR